MMTSPAKTWFQSPKGLVAGQYDGLLFPVAFTGITYRLGSATLGTLTYAYDQLGRRTQVGGAFARTALPAAIASATYDGANELTNWNGTNLSYDANGNMLGDASGNTFTWNSRNQVAKLNTVALQYDAFGRRIKNAAGTSFLYDGANAVQELSGSTVTANLLSGGIDEVFTRSDSSGAFTQLKDALGSTFALVDSSGNVQTAYTYDPFGNTSVTGTSNGNEFQYTGRENEGNGLYFYRARYYSPLLGRFVSEDPVGFGGGLNLYTYVFDSPTDLADPSGNCPTCAEPTAQVVTTAVGSAAAGGTATTVATGGGSGPVVTLIAGGSADGVGAGPVGAVAGAGAAVLVGYGYYGYQAITATQNANTADQELMQAIHNWNQAVMAKNRAQPPLAGRYTFQPSDEDAEECNKQWKNAAEYCSQLDDIPRDTPEWKKVVKIFGGSIFNCMKGQVSERCGGNKVIP